MLFFTHLDQLCFWVSLMEDFGSIPLQPFMVVLLDGILIFESEMESINSNCVPFDDQYFDPEKVSTLDHAQMHFH